MFYELNCFRFRFLKNDLTPSTKLSLGRVGKYASHLRRVEIQSGKRPNYIRLTLLDRPTSPGVFSLRGEAVLEQEDIELENFYLLRSIWIMPSTECFADIGTVRYAFQFLEEFQAPWLSGFPWIDLINYLAFLDRVTYSLRLVREKPGLIRIEAESTTIRSRWWTRLVR
jgi:hypothetical protein